MAILIITSCTNGSVDVIKKDDYLVNKRSLKIHSLDCDSISLMREHNKKEVHESIEYLVKNGYIVCEKCKARKRKKLLGIIDNPFRKKEFVIDTEDLPSKSEYLDAITKIGEWYINHIPTYQGKLSEENLYDYKGNDKYYKEYNLKTKNVKMKIFANETTKKYKVISTNSNAKKLEELNKNTNVLKAKEEAIINYKNNYSKIDIKASQAYYPCEYINDSKDSYKKAGDDCIRFFFTIMNSFDKEFTYRFSTIVKEKWSQVNTAKLYNDRGKYAKAMTMNGFEVYDITSGKIGDIKINKIDNEFVLLYGDIIVRDGHLHIYLGNGFGLSENFGWGKVNRIFPQKYYYKIIKNKNYFCIGCENDKTNDGNYREYHRVYRYVGDKINDN